MRTGTVCTLIIAWLFLFSSCGVDGLIKNDRAETVKYNSYVELLNYNNGTLLEYVRKYFAEFGSEPEIAVKENFKDFKFGSSLTDDKTSKAREYQKKQPSFGAIDEHALTLCDKTDAMAGLIKEVNGYYEGREFLLDEFAKAREYHGRMIAANTELRESMDAFSSSLKEKTLERESSPLAVYEEKGYMIHYHSLKLLLSGKAINTLFEELEKSGAGFLEADSAQYEELYNAFITDYECLLAVYANEEQQGFEGYSQSNVTAITQFVDIANLMKSSSSIIREQIMDRDDLGDKNSAVRFRQSLAELIVQYNASVK